MHTTNFRGLQTARVVTLAALYAASASGGTYDVDRMDDTNAASACTAAPNDCSLRGAIILANATAGADTIVLREGTYLLTLAGSDDAAGLGDLDITDSTGALTVDRVGREHPVIDANHLDRVFHVLSGASASFSGLTIQGGSALRGSGIWNLGTLSVSDCTLSGNGYNGGGDGGGILNQGAATLTNTTLSGNNGLLGAGINNEGQLTATNCTLSGNSAATGLGGGIWNGGTLKLTNCTVVDNPAVDGGGIYQLHGPPATLSNSILATNGLGRNCSSSVNSQGFNLSDDRSCGLVAAGDLENVAADLAPALASNGGPTQTHALCLAAGVPHSRCTGRSPAIDAGDNDRCPATDQRHVPRPQDGRPDPAAMAVCDIGAFETPPLPCPDPSGDDTTDIVDALFIAQYTVGLRSLSCQLPTAPAPMTLVKPAVAE